MEEKVCFLEKSSLCIFFKNRVEVKNDLFLQLAIFLDRPEVEILPDHFPWLWSDRKVSIFDRKSKVYWFEAPSHGNSAVFLSSYSYRE